MPGCFADDRLVAVAGFGAANTLRTTRVSVMNGATRAEVAALGLNQTLSSDLTRVIDHKCRPRLRRFKCQWLFWYTADCTADGAGSR